MKREDKENIDRIRARLFDLIGAEFESDAAFERAMGLPDKTVNNWRRERSASFMKMLPALADLFRLPLGEFLDLPLPHDGAELSEEEWHLLRLFRRARTLPKARRAALAQTLETVIRLYLPDSKIREYLPGAGEV